MLFSLMYRDHGSARLSLPLCPVTFMLLTDLAYTCLLSATNIDTKQTIID